MIDKQDLIDLFTDKGSLEAAIETLTHQLNEAYKEYKEKRVQEQEVRKSLLKDGYDKVQDGMALIAQGTSCSAKEKESLINAIYNMTLEEFLHLTGFPVQLEEQGNEVLNTLAELGVHVDRDGDTFKALCGVLADLSSIWEDLKK